MQGLLACLLQTRAHLHQGPSPVSVRTCQRCALNLNWMRCAAHACRTGCDPVDVGGLLGSEATKARFVSQLMLTLDLDSSEGVIQFDIIKLNTVVFDAGAFVSAQGTAPPLAAPTTDTATIIDTTRANTSLPPRNSTTV